MPLRILSEFTTNLWKHTDSCKIISEIYLIIKHKYPYCKQSKRLRTFLREIKFYIDASHVLVYNINEKLIQGVPLP